MTEFGASAPEIVWREMVHLYPLSASSDDIPDHIFGYSLTPSSSMAAHGSEDSAGSYVCRLPPSIDCVLDPRRHRNCADMTTLAHQIHDGPMSLPDLQVLNCKCRELGAAQSATDKHGNHCNVPETAQILAICFFQ